MLRSYLDEASPTGYESAALSALAELCRRSDEACSTLLDLAIRSGQPGATSTLEAAANQDPSARARLIPLAVEALRSPEPARSGPAALLLLRIGEVRPLLALDDPETRQTLRTFARGRDPDVRVVEAFRIAATDPDDRVRKAAAEVLAIFDAP